MSEQSNGAARRTSPPVSVLVVGSTGLIGAHVTRVLLGAGHRVRALVRDPKRAQGLAALGAEIAVGDLADQASLERALDAVEAALLVSNLTPEQVTLQGNFVTAATRAGRPRIVKISGFLTAIDSPARSGRWHARTEAAIEASGMPWTFLRAPFFMQNLLRTQPHAVSSGELAMPVDTARVAMVDARDLGDVAAHALVDDGHAGRAYLVTGPEAITFREAAARLGRHTGRPVTFRLTTPADTRAALTAAGAPQWRRDLVMEFYEGFEAGLGAEVTDTVARVAGHRSRSLEAFLDSEAARAALQAAR